ncbi:MAG: D-alanyl-D-alanine carboxypeptidase [Alphaproteobacteria bacterium]|nr:D-alanyl-D-alanine carboxypeptidase [Alphaproteobacteria bacterium]
MLSFQKTPLCAAVFAIALTLVTGGPAAAVEAASIVIDAENGAVLHGEAVDQPTPPASLTKMMTLYLTFEALKGGEMRPQARLRASAHAARQRPSRLGLRRGDVITVHESILALVTKSANDAAVVLAEAIAGSESRFAERMNTRAKALNMQNTHFRNASGLYHKKQLSTARDLALLAEALFRDFPEYAPYFTAESFRFKGRTYRNHNDFLKNYPGAEGIKTGYIRASGYNLAASASRGGRRLIGIVLGEASSTARETHMRVLFDRGFQTAAILDESWEIQVGDVARLATAHLVASSAARRVPDLLHRADLTISPVRDGRVTHYRARFLGIGESLARKACQDLQANGIACNVISPFQAKRVGRVIEG